MLSRASSSPIDIFDKAAGDGGTLASLLLLTHLQTLEHPLSLLDISFRTLVGSVVL
jgi:hypothetical protein